MLPCRTLWSVPARSGVDEIEQEPVGQLLVLIDVEYRKAILDSPEVFAKFVQQDGSALGDWHASLQSSDRPMTMTPRAIRKPGRDG